jgi:peptidyl-prolyl cis-trans isomerase B (cyclophilin B)
VASSKDRERELARRRLERRALREAQQRAARRRAMLAIAGTVAAVLLAVGAIAIFTGGGEDKVSTTTQPTGTTSGSSGGCVYNKTPDQPASKNSKGLPPANPAHTDRTATIETNRGTVKVSLLGSKAPCAVNSFIHLAQASFYDGTSCHRITDSGVVQCGDPTGTGSGGPGYQFLEENLPTAATGAPYPTGTLAMAKSSAPGSSGSQFFIVTKDNTFDGPNYTIFGKVLSGLDVLEKVVAGGSVPAGDGKPQLSLVLKKITIS